jgi:integrase
VTFPTRGDASTWLTPTEARIARGWTPTIHERVTVEQWSARWLAAASPHLKRTTVVMYEHLLRLSILPTFGSRPLRDVRPIEVFGVDRRPDGEGEKHVLGPQVLPAAVPAHDGGGGQRPDPGVAVPAAEAAPPGRAGEPRILTRAEVDDLIACSKGQGRLIVQLLAFAGARIGEVLSLRRDDVSEDGRVLRVDERQIELKGHVDFDLPKAHQQWTITVPDFVAAELLAYLAERVGPDPRALMFTGRTGTPLRYGSWRRWTWVPAVKAAGLEA